MVPKRRLELPRGYPHMNLNHARLPIPPLRPYKSAAKTFLIIINQMRQCTTGNAQSVLTIP